MPKHASHSLARSFLLTAALLLAGAGTAAGQVEVESLVWASSVDEIFEPFDTEEGYEEDGSDVAGEALRVRASSCLDPCTVMEPYEGEAQSDARTHYGENEVGVYSESWFDGSNSSYHDEAGATSRWRDEITLTSEGPVPGGTVRADFRIEGSWQNLACFGFVAFLYDPSSIQPGCVNDCCGCPTVASVAGVDNGVEGACEVLLPYGQQVGPFLPVLPDHGEEDGDAAVTISVQLPLLLDSPLHFGAFLSGATGAMEHSSLESGVTASVESLHVPAGVQVSSAAGAGALARYHVNAPEPSRGASAAAAAALLAALRVRRGTGRG
jgi:hypothetical protein